MGVNIRGRSSKRRINDRTTAQIIRWSLTLMRKQVVDDLDGGLDSMAGCRSEMRGSEPVLTGLTTAKKELEHLVHTVEEWTRAGVLPEEIGVSARANRSVEQAVEELEKAGVPAVPLAKGRAAEGAVSVGTMHRMKGLEFRCLAVIGVSQDQLPAPRSLTPESEDTGAHARDLLRERSLLFVACTRAREQLSISWTGQPSPFLDTLLNPGSTHPSRAPQQKDEHQSKTVPPPPPDRRRNDPAPGIPTRLRMEPRPGTRPDAVHVPGPPGGESAAVGNLRPRGHGPRQCLRQRHLPDAVGRSAAHHLAVRGGQGTPTRFLRRR